MKRQINTPEEQFKLKQLIVAAARVHQEHSRFPRDHNFEMQFALLDAAGKQ